MLLDGYWKRDLIKIKRQLKYRSRRGGSIMCKYAEHRINRCLLFSAAIIRKIIEDEADAETIMKHDNMPLPPFRILHSTVPLTTYKHIDEEKFFVNSRMILSDYDTKNAGQIELPLTQVCNQLIHSYVWGVVHSGNKVYGVMTASDRFKEKEAYLLKIEDWITALEFVIENCHIYSKESIV